MADELKKENIIEDKHEVQTDTQTTETTELDNTAVVVADGSENTNTEQPKAVYVESTVSYADPNLQHNKPDAKAIASLILGIVSILASVASVAILPAIISLVCGVVGLILSVKSKKENPTGVATGGFVTSIIGMVLAIIGIIVAIVLFGAIAAIAGVALQSVLAI